MDSFALLIQKLTLSVDGNNHYKICYSELLWTREIFRLDYTVVDTSKSHIGLLELLSR